MADPHFCLSEAWSARLRPLIPTKRRSARCFCPAHPGRACTPPRMPGHRRGGPPKTCGAGQVRRASPGPRRPRLGVEATPSHPHGKPSPLDAPPGKARQNRSANLARLHNKRGVSGVYADNLQGGCFHVEANSSPKAVAAVERRATPETAHIAYDFIVLVTLPGTQFNEYRAPDA